MSDVDNSLGQSPLWEYINQNQLRLDALKDLQGFKSNSINFKISIWNPQTNGMRYLKTLLYNLCVNLSSENWQRLRCIHNRSVGDPIVVQYDGEQVCMDYLQAVYELDFISSQINLDNKKVLEIGAGYGRTCHALISNCAITDYFIIDLINCLQLAKSYLRAVLTDDQFSKIHFVSVDEINLIESENFDLSINIDSFAEMNANTVNQYLSFINQHCSHFYVKNPVGKYLDKTIDNHSQGSEVVAMALKTGVLRDIIDINDNQAIEMQREKFVTAYCPPGSWKCLANTWAIPWSYYWQAFYQKLS